MDKSLPFLMTLVTFILVWGGMLLYPYIEKSSPNKAYAYSSVAMFAAIIMFVVLSCIYNYENYDMTADERKEEFTFKYDGLFD